MLSPSLNFFVLLKVRENYLLIVVSTRRIILFKSITILKTLQYYILISIHWTSSEFIANCNSVASKNIKTEIFEFALYGFTAIPCDLAFLAI